MSVVHRAAQMFSAVGVTLVFSACSCPRLPAPDPAPPQSVSTTSTDVRTPAEQLSRRAVAGRDAATIGKVTCEVVSIRVGKPRYKSFRGEYDGPEELVVLTVRFTTPDDTIKRRVADIGRVFTDAKATDNFGNDYTFHGSDDAVGNQHDSLTAEKPVTKMVLIEKPIPKATRLDLDIPASGVDEKGTFRFTIPLDQATK